MPGRLETRSRIGVVLGFVWAIVVSLWNLIDGYGNLQTAREILKERGPIMNTVGALLLSQWTGPLIAGGSLLFYVVLRSKERRDSRLAISVETDTVGARPREPDSSEETSKARRNSIVAGLAKRRHDADDLRTDVRTGFMPSIHHSKLSSLVRDTYDYIHRNVSKTEAELFIDRTNLMVPTLGITASSCSRDEQDAVLNDLQHYSNRLTSLIGRIDKPLS